MKVEYIAHTTNRSSSWSSVTKPWPTPKVVYLETTSCDWANWASILGKLIHRRGDPQASHLCREELLVQPMRQYLCLILAFCQFTTPSAPLSTTTPSLLLLVLALFMFSLLVFFKSADSTAAMIESVIGVTSIKSLWFRWREEDVHESHWFVSINFLRCKN